MAKFDWSQITVALPWRFDFTQEPASSPETGDERDV